MLKKRFDRGLRNNLTFWRNNTGHETYLLTENAGQLTLIEIEVNQPLAGDWLKGLHKLAFDRRRRCAKPTFSHR